MPTHSQLRQIMMNVSEKLREKGLKVTPQRMAIYNAVAQLKNHPTAEHVLDKIKADFPSISVATVYKVLNILVEKGLLSRVKSEKDVMRYDAMQDHHHHMYCTETDRIEDYQDDQLDEILKNYFEKKNIENFSIEDFKLVLTGTFLK